MTTIREATELWVNNMNAIDSSIIEELMSYNPDDWHEVTIPAVGDRVYYYSDGDEGEIVDVNDDDEYVIELDCGKTVHCDTDDFEVLYDYSLPIWGTMWSFGDSADDYWLDELDGIRKMSECGFRVFESYNHGYFFGIDGAGYSFYESHWLPLYKVRGLKWHDTEDENA